MCVSISRDRTVKVFDVVGYDMIVMMKLQYTPGCAEWVFKVRVNLVVLRCVTLCCIMLCYVRTSAYLHLSTSSARQKVPPACALIASPPSLFFQRRVPLLSLNLNLSHTL